MAVWSFKLNLLPRQSVLKKFGKIPDVIDEYKSCFDYSELIEDEEGTNFWKGYDVRSIGINFGQLLPCIDSWSDSMDLYGDEKGSKVEVWSDDIYLKLDARGDNDILLEKCVKVAKLIDCIFVVEESGKVIEPDVELLMLEYRNSRAYRFVDSPEEVLEEVRLLNNKTDTRETNPEK